jgi:hypothetical protein
MYHMVGTYVNIKECHAFYNNLVLNFVPDFGFSLGSRVRKEFPFAFIH